MKQIRCKVICGDAYPEYYIQMDKNSPIALPKEIVEKYQEMNNLRKEIHGTLYEYHKIYDEIVFLQMKFKDPQRWTPQEVADAKRRYNELVIEATKLGFAPNRF